MKLVGVREREEGEVDGVQDAAFDAIDRVECDIVKKVFKNSCNYMCGE